MAESAIFKARMDDGDLFKKIISSVLELCKECNFECSEDGIQCQCMDSSHVSLVAMNLKAEGFAEFSCSEDITLGLQLEQLNKVLKCSGAKDSLQILAETTETLKLTFENASQDKLNTFDVKLLTVDEESLAIPETEYKCIVTMPSTEFANICRNLGTLGDSVTISATKNGVCFNTSGDMAGANILLKHNETAENEKSIKIEMEEPLTQQFALRYLNNFAKSSVLSNQVTLCMSDEVPLKVEFKMDDLGTVKFFLAPKIGDEDENE